MTFLIIAVVIALGIAGLVLMGMRSRTIFTNPDALPDRQIAAIIDLSRKIMARSRPGSATWSRAAARYKAAVDEQRKRLGHEPFSEIELTTPSEQ